MNILLDMLTKNLISDTCDTCIKRYQCLTNLKVTIGKSTHFDVAYNKIRVTLMVCCPHVWKQPNMEDYLQIPPLWKIKNSTLLEDNTTMILMLERDGVNDKNY